MALGSCQTSMQPLRGEGRTIGWVWVLKSMFHLKFDLTFDTELLQTLQWTSGPNITSILGQEGFRFGRTPHSIGDNQTVGHLVGFLLGCLDITSRNLLQSSWNFTDVLTYMQRRLRWLYRFLGYSTWETKGSMRRSSWWRTRWISLEFARIFVVLERLSM